MRVSTPHTAMLAAREADMPDILCRQFSSSGRYNNIECRPVADVTDPNFGNLSFSEGLRDQYWHTSVSFCRFGCAQVHLERDHRDNDCDNRYTEFQAHSATSS